MAEESASEVPQYEPAPIIGFVVGNEDPVTMCAACGVEEIERVAEIRDGKHYGDKVPYPECFECGGVIRPQGPPRNHYRCKRCGERFESITAVEDHSKSHSSEVNIPLYEVVDRDE